MQDTDDMKFLNKLIRDGKETSEIWYKKGRIYETHQKYTEAIQSFNKALVLDSECKKAQNQINQINKKTISEDLMPKVKKILSHFIFEQITLSYDDFTKNYLRELEYYENSLGIASLPNYGIQKLHKYKDFVCKSFNLVRNNVTMNFDQLILTLANEHCIVNQEQHDHVWELVINELDENLHEFDQLYRLFCSDFQGFYDPGLHETLSKHITAQFNHLMVLYNSK